MVATPIEQIELPEAARERYLRYAMSVITSRALPDVRDGLKPVQRRILFAMERDLGLGGGARPVKSAKVVGQVMSNYHPHGDMAIYEAMVRMAQDWSLRYPLVEGQGNFGAIAGDDAAAFRYTEARLQPLASELMEVLGEETVAFRPNYDGTAQEPEVLPTPLPLLLLNGSTGIAVGMATNIPPHNLGEVVKAASLLIEKPDSTVAQLLRHVKGPDFPTGGEVLTTREELKKIYETGRGSLRLRGTWRLEETKAERQRLPRRSLIVDSIPYGTTTGQVMVKVKELIEQKKLPQVLHASDQTNADDGVKLVFELRTDTDLEPEKLMAGIYKLTPLETTWSVNLTCLLPTPSGVGRPSVCDLKQLLRSWLDFRFEVVTRSIQFRRHKLLQRIHILEGLAKVLGALDAAIKLIRAAQDRADARTKLEKKFGLDAPQADAVLEIMLYRLAQLEVKKVQDELAEKKKEVARLEKLLKGDQPRWELIQKELAALAERYGDKRRTVIRAGEGDEAQYDAAALLVREDVFVFLTREGRVKRTKSYEDPGKVRVREEDELLTVLQGSTVAPCAFFTNYGSAYVLPIHEVPPTAGYGEPIQKHFNFKDGERVVGAVSLDPRLVPPDPELTLFAATAAGNVLRVPLQPHREPSTRAGRKLLKLAEGDEVVAVEVVLEPKADALLCTSGGHALRTPVAEVPLLSAAGKGKRGVELGKGETLIGATVGPALLLETTRGAQEELVARDLSRAELGGPGVEIKQRGGWRRVLPVPPAPRELPKDEGGASPAAE